MRAYVCAGTFGTERRKNKMAAHSGHWVAASHTKRTYKERVEEKGKNQQIILHKIDSWLQLNRTEIKILEFIIGKRSIFGLKNVSKNKFKLCCVSTVCTV